MDRTVNFILRGEPHEMVIPDPDTTDLDEDFVTQSGLFYFFAAAYGWAERHEKGAKYDLECAYAQLDKEYRGTLQKATEKIVESHILTDTRYVTMQNAFLDALENKNTLWAACEAMKQRKDMLVQLGAQRRAEANAGFGTT